MAVVVNVVVVVVVGVVVVKVVIVIVVVIIVVVAVGVEAAEGFVVVVVVIKVRAIKDPFYGSPPNFSLTKSPVSKPAPGRISWNTVSLDTPRSSIVRRLHTRKYTDTFFSIVSFLVSSRHETFVKENRRCWGGLS